MKRERLCKRSTVMSWRGLVLLGLFLGIEPCIAAEPRVVKPVCLTLNTTADEDEPFLASSGLILYYSSSSLKKDKLDILVSQRRAATQSWPRGSLLEGYVQTPADDRGVFVTRDG